MVDMFFKFKYRSHDLRLHWRLRTPKYRRILNDSLDKVFLSDSCLCFSVTLHNHQGILPYRSKAMMPQFFFFYMAKFHSSGCSWLLQFMVEVFKRLNISNTSGYICDLVDSFWKTCLDKIMWENLLILEKLKKEKKIC